MTRKLQCSDESVIRRILEDDPNAFEELVARYQRPAHAIASAAGVPADSRDDVVQESFLRAFRSLPGLRQAARFGPWFFHIVRNEARRSRGRWSIRKTARSPPDDDQHGPAI